MEILITDPLQAGHCIGMRRKFRAQELKLPEDFQCGKASKFSMDTKIEFRSRNAKLHKNISALEKIFSQDSFQCPPAIEITPPDEDQPVSAHRHETKHSHMATSIRTNGHGSLPSSKISSVRRGEPRSPISPFPTMAARSPTNHTSAIATSKAECKFTPHYDSDPGFNDDDSVAYLKWTLAVPVEAA